jgi:hypothetical protein
MKTLDQTSIKVLRVSEAIEQTAKAIFVGYHDKDFSFVDCTSVALIDHHRLGNAFFDLPLIAHEGARSITPRAPRLGTACERHMDHVKGSAEGIVLPPSRKAPSSENSLH